MAHIILEYDVASLSNVKIHHGPLIYDSKNSDNFRNKYPNAYIHNNKWISLSNRKYITVEDMIKNILLEENMSILKLGKNIKEEVLKDYSFEKMEVFINNTNDENLNNIFLYLHPNYRLEH